MRPSAIFGVFMAAAMSAGSVPAQQPNQPNARLLVNGRNGPAWPIIGVDVPPGALASLHLSGQPSMPFVIGVAPALAAAGTPALGGLLDLDASTFGILHDGTTNATYRTGPGGGYSETHIVSPSLAPWSESAIQAVVADAGSPAGAAMTAATLVVATAPASVIPLVLPDDGFTAVSLAPFGIAVPFYNQIHTTMFVNSNGSISFGSGSADYTPTSAEFVSESPRIAGYWSDLNPVAGGTIRVRIVETSPVALIRLDFDHVAEFASLLPHTTSILVYGVPLGDIVIIESADSPQNQVDALVGISPGNNSGIQPPRNLSALPVAGVTGAVNENFHEFFPFGVPSWDLAGKTLTFTGIGAGTAAARYVARIAP